MNGRFRAFSLLVFLCVCAGLVLTAFLAISFFGKAPAEEPADDVPEAPVIAAVGSETVLMHEELLPMADSGLSRYYDIEADGQSYRVFIAGNDAPVTIPADKTTVYVMPGGTPYVEQVAVNYFAPDGSVHQKELFYLAVREE